ncbi:MAG TPA: four helix bundle protein [Chitinophagales bacterium]|nr:four helix bundle protein [Chitinophagales bacterium]
MHDFRKLEVWQRTLNLTLEVYKVTANFPKEEMFGLKSQINRSVVSIPTNIAEGAGRNTRKDFNRFLSYATGSCYELETQLIIAERLGYIPPTNFLQIKTELNIVGKMIFNLKKQLNSPKP